MSELARRHSIGMAHGLPVPHEEPGAGYYLKGMRWHTWGENIGVHRWHRSRLQQAFMPSPPHRANILEQAFRHVAIGTARDEDGILWVTVFFYG